MTKLLLFLAATIGGSVGWWIGSVFGVMSAFIFSMVGTAAGVYVARRFSAEFMV